MTEPGTVLALELNHENAAAPPEAAGVGHPTPEELVAKAIAPVKREYFRPPPERSSEKKSDSVSQSDGNQANDDAKSDASESIVKEKKSKRQLKRERREVVLFFYLSNLNFRALKLQTWYIL